MATHDQDLIKACDFDQVWELEDGQLEVFDCSWVEFLRQKELLKVHQQAKIEALVKEKRDLKKAVEFERQSASRRANVNANENDKILRRKMEASGEATSSKKLGKYSKKLEQNEVERAGIVAKKEFAPRFNLVGKTSGKTLVQVSDGEVFYASAPSTSVVSGVNLLISSDSKLLISGRNGSGKSTLLKAIAKSAEVGTKGFWNWSGGCSIAVLDQHYQILFDDKTVFDQIKDTRPDWTTQEVQKHLNAFLFTGPVSTGAKVANLSGGERARLALAIIGAATPSLLILDEPSNNLDSKTKAQMAKVIHDFPGAIVLVCHEQSFIDSTELEWEKYCL